MAHRFYNPCQWCGTRSRMPVECVVTASEGRCPESEGNLRRTELSWCRHDAFYPCSKRCQQEVENDNMLMLKLEELGWKIGKQKKPPSD